MAKTAFVTGATGFIGRHLLDVLLEQDFDITALARSPEKADLPASVSVCKGDITQASDVLTAMPKGVDVVFHVAADTSSWRKEKARQHEINVTGTENMIAAALEQGAGRLIHVSSVAVFGPQRTEINEATPLDGLDSWVSYVSTKAKAEKRVREAVARGLDAVIVNPTHVVGKYDTANWARLIMRSASGDLPGIPPGAGNFANGRAVAEAMVTAFERAPKGANYLLGGPLASFEEFVRISAEHTGNSVKAKVMPGFLLNTLSSVSQLVSTFTGKRPNLTPEEAYFATEFIAASSERAVQELGYRTLPLAVSISESVSYLREKGLLEKLPE